MTGVTPTGSGSQATPEAADASSPSVSIPNAFQRRVDFQRAYDKRDPDPAKNYGIGSMRIRFVLIGELGAVQWMIGTPWDVPTARGPKSWRDPSRPDGWDLGYHSPHPMYDGQEPMSSCDVLDCHCYYDGSGLNADLLIENFVAQGGEYVWAALEAYYRSVFHNEPWPFDGSGNILASAMSARSGETEGLAPQDASATAEGRDAQTPTSRNPNP